MTSETVWSLRGGRVLAYAVGVHVILSLGAPLRTYAQGVGAGQPTTAPAAGEPAARGKGAAHAGPKRATTAAEAPAREGEASDANAEYRALVDQALSEFKLENWPEARLLFRRAHELIPSARTLRGIGIVSFEMRDYVPAVVALTEALTDARQPLTAAQRKECEELLARARTFVASFALRLEPSTAELKVDGGAAVRDRDGRLLLSFGEHTLEASAPGYETATKKLAVAGHEHVALEIVLTRPAPAATATPVRGVTPPASRELGVAQPPSRSLTDSTTRGGLRYTWVALGASAAFGGAAAATWFSAERKFEQLKDDCRAAAALGSPCTPGATDTDAVKRSERVTNALLGMSAASLLTAVILMPIEWPRERRLALDVSPRHVGLRGSF